MAGSGVYVAITDDHGCYVKVVMYARSGHVTVPLIHYHGTHWYSLEIHYHNQENTVEILDLNGSQLRNRKHKYILTHFSTFFDRFC